MESTNTLGRTCPHSTSIKFFCGQDNTYVCQSCKDKDHQFHIALPIKTLAETVQLELRNTEKKARAMTREIDMLPFTIAKELFKDIQEKFNREMASAKEDMQQNVHELGKKILNSFKKTVDLGEIQMKVAQEVEKVKQMIECGDYFSVTANFQNFTAKLKGFGELQSIVDSANSLDMKSDLDSLKENISKKFKDLISESKNSIDQYINGMSNKIARSNSQEKEVPKNNASETVTQMANLKVSGKVEEWTPEEREIMYFLNGSKLIKLDLKNQQKSEIKHNVTFNSYPNVLLTKANKLFVAGGHENYTEMYEFEFATSQFVFKANMNEKRTYGHAFIELREGFMMVFGGRGSNGVPLNSCELYDVQGNKWVQMPYLSQKRSYPTAFAIQEKLVYVVGGSDTTYLNSIEKISFGENVFNPISGWQMLQITNQGLLTPCCVLASLVVGEKEVLLFGGYNHQNNTGNNLNQCVKFDIETNEMSKPKYQLAHNDNFYRNYSAYYNGVFHYVSRDNHILHKFDGSKWEYVSGIF